MRLIQFLTKEMTTCVGLVQEDAIRPLQGLTSVLALAEQAWSLGSGMETLAERWATGDPVDYQMLIDERRLLPPATHPDPARCLVSGTGLTHLGSASARDAMHKAIRDGGEDNLSDSMKMFKCGVEGGKPLGDAPGVQPEWFYKGDGRSVVPPEGDLEMPPFAIDGGEEPEIAGVYLIARDGTPLRIGFVLGNEFSDHAMEQQNYLYLAHSKLRSCSFGPELLLGPLPSDLYGTSRIIRKGSTVWEKPFLSGEDNMCHSIANLEHHHFKYRLFRRPGDLHVHYFGTATLSHADGIAPIAGDVFEIHLPALGRPLRNRLIQSEPENPITVMRL